MSDKKKRAAAGAIEEEEAFVRGGGSGLAPIVKKPLEQVRFAVLMCALIRQSSHKTHACCHSPHADHRQDLLRAAGGGQLVQQGHTTVMHQRWCRRPAAREDRSQ